MNAAAIDFNAICRRGSIACTGTKVPRAGNNCYRSREADDSGDFAGGVQMRSFSYWICVFVMCLVGGMPHLLAAQEPTDTWKAGETSDQSAMVIGPGDLLDLTVFNVPELILKARVDSGGLVNLPLIGDVSLGGITVRDAELLIARALVARDMVRTPEVSMLVEEFATQGITVGGEVNQPGIYPLMGPHRLYDAISAAGGLTPRAGHTITILHHGQKDHPEVVNLPARTPTEQGDVTIYPGDTVIVSKAGLVYVVGEVNKPGAFVMENNTSISLLKAVALSQGTSKFASLKHVFLIRETSTGMVPTKLELDKIYRGKLADPILHAEDIVFVPTSNWKVYEPMGIQGAIQAAVYSTYALMLP
jgi:polysaccharide biosynthesis/export protein